MRRKFKKGTQIVSVAEFLEHDWFIVNGKTFHRGWCMSWSLKLAQVYVDRGVAYIAERLTNGEYYSDKTDEELRGMLDERLCDFCPLPDELKGVHCYGGEPVMCEGSHCKEAMEAWKEEDVELSG